MSDKGFVCFWGQVSIEYGLAELMNKYAIRNPPQPQSTEPWHIPFEKLYSILPSGVVDTSVQSIVPKVRTTTPRNYSKLRCSTVGSTKFFRMFDARQSSIWWETVQIKATYDELLFRIMTKCLRQQNQLMLRIQVLRWPAWTWRSYMLNPDHM